MFYSPANYRTGQLFLWLTDQTGQLWGRVRNTEKTTNTEELPIDFYHIERFQVARSM